MFPREGKNGASKFRAMLSRRALEALCREALPSISPATTTTVIESSGSERQNLCCLVRVDTPLGPRRGIEKAPLFREPRVYSTPSQKARRRLFFATIPAITSDSSPCGARRCGPRTAWPRDGGGRGARCAILSSPYPGPQTHLSLITHFLKCPSYTINPREF